MKSKAKPRNIFSHVRSDPIVNEVLDSFKNEENIYWAGGLVGVQSYIPENLQRRSGDMDFIYLGSTPNTTKIKETFNESLDDLMDKGFDIDITRKRETIDIDLNRDNEFMRVQTKRRNQNNYDKHIDVITDNYLLAKPIELYGTEALIAAPETMIVDKLVRMNAFNRRGDLKPSIVTRATSASLRDSELTSILENLENRRTRLFENIEKSRLDIESERKKLITEKIENRYFSDMFDISALDSSTKLDEEVFQSQIEDLSKKDKNFIYTIGKTLLTENRSIF